ncbi:MAG: 1,4-alpha-glucan branching protein GlgB [Candidatus Sericytochromatia bacterium]|nr:1,4-alpha-glucan branching protein GlgB [Candidatus Sericytochromatia bacterium]
MTTKSRKKTPKPAESVVPVSPELTPFDLYLLNQGCHYLAYEKMGAHPMERDGERGWYFAVWAPNAREVSVIGDWNLWQHGQHALSFDPAAGIWSGFFTAPSAGARYKFSIISGASNHYVAKADPYAFATEQPPGTASVLTDLAGYAWGDGAWMEGRAARQAPEAPISIYEVHLGSWRRGADGNWLSYRDMAPQLAAYAAEMGYTHVELLPITEHPFYGSWGYQTTAYFAPTARFGSPHDLKYLIDTLHQAGVGVILDWVPAHFPRDEHGLAYFDGTHLYEHQDPRQGLHAHWNTFIFNYGRREVANFLIASAMFWLREYHIDGLRVDAVASMLYLDYGRSEGDWVPNAFGGRENLDAIGFLRHFNEVIAQQCPGAITIAEESTAWPRVTGSPAEGGLGFTFKWNMGWMHDMLDYMATDPVYRRYHHNRLTFSMMYAYSERYVLSFSHDEVVHLKRSMSGKMPGDDWQKLANLRLLLGYMTGHPGKKLLFMGQEFGQWWEWNHDTSLAWHLLQEPAHLGLSNWSRDLNRLLTAEKALSAGDYHPWGFKWVDCHDADHSIVSFLRYDQEDPEQALLFVSNFTPVPRSAYRLGVPWEGPWTEVLNSDAQVYGGSGLGNMGQVQAEDIAWHGHSHSLNVMLPPLSTVVFKAPPRPRPELPEPTLEPSAASSTEPSDGPQKVPPKAGKKSKAQPEGTAATPRRSAPRRATTRAKKDET